jgi:hypothetical protein
MVMLALTIQSISITLFWWNWVELPLLIVEPYDLRSLKRLCNYAMNEFNAYQVRGVSYYER